MKIFLMTLIYIIFGKAGDLRLELNFLNPRGCFHETQNEISFHHEKILFVAMKKYISFRCGKNEMKLIFALIF